MTNANRFLAIARMLALKSDNQDHKHGCVVVYKNKIIGKGYNKTSTHPKSNSRYKKLHAEVSAINNALKSFDELSRCVLYVYREHKDGTPALSKPCKSCAEYINTYGINVVVYTIQNGWKLETYESL